MTLQTPEAMERSRAASLIEAWREIEPAAFAVVARGAMRITEARDVSAALMIGEKLAECLETQLRSGAK